MHIFGYVHGVFISLGTIKCSMMVSHWCARCFFVFVFFVLGGGDLKERIFSKWLLGDDVKI